VEGPRGPWTRIVTADGDELGPVLGVVGNSLLVYLVDVDRFLLTSNLRGGSLGQAASGVYYASPGCVGQAYLTTSYTNADYVQSAAGKLWRTTSTSTTNVAVNSNLDGAGTCSAYVTSIYVTPAVEVVHPHFPFGEMTLAYN
jgi:hypothetical protein